MAISIKSTSGPNSVPENSKPSPKPETHPRKRGDGYIYQREGSGNWWICYYFRGKPHRESSYSTDPAVALKKLDKHVKELWAAKQGLAAFVPKAEKVFVDELLDELEQHYKLNGGLAQFRSHLKPVRKAFGESGRTVDLATIAARRLSAAGVESIEDVGCCTICDPSFFSHRRDAGRTGRHLAFIAAGRAL